MRFNLVLANQPVPRLRELEDILRPLLIGLRAAGHHVVAGAQEYKPAPMVNLVIEDFGDAGFARALVETRRQSGASFRFGVLCPTRIEALPPERREGLGAVLPSSDFVLTLEDIKIPAEYCPPARVVSLAYGFDEKLIGPRLISDPALRDIDVVFYGPAGVRVSRLAEQIAQAGLGYMTVHPGAMPDYLVTDLLSRAKAVVAIDGQPAAGGMAARMIKAICNGAAVIIEPPAPAGTWQPGAIIPCAYDDIPARCRTVTGEGNYVTLGFAGLDRFRAGVAMGDCIANALNLPVFAALRGT